MNPRHSPANRHRLCLRARVLLPALVGFLCLVGTAVAFAPESASAAESFTVHASFTPDRLGVPTNLSATATFGSSAPGSLPPVTKVTAYAPAGMSVDTRGAGVCAVTAARLQEVGPSACPADSRIGFGNGQARMELAGEAVTGPFTLEFFLARPQGGHRVLLVYANATSPASVQLGLLAREIQAPKPYGIGLTFDIPIIPTLPGAGLGWVEHIALSFGSSNVAYYRTVHGRRRLLHVKGLIAPRTCPRGGFPIEAMVEYADATTSTAKTTIPCPRR